MLNFEILCKLTEIVYQGDTVTKAIFVDRHGDEYLFSISKTNRHLNKWLNVGDEYAVNATLNTYRKSSGIIYNNLYINRLVPFNTQTNQQEAHPEDHQEAEVPVEELKNQAERRKEAEQ